MSLKSLSVVNWGNTILTTPNIHRRSLYLEYYKLWLPTITIIKEVIYTAWLKSNSLIPLSIPPLALVIAHTYHGSDKFVQCHNIYYCQEPHLFSSISCIGDGRLGQLYHFPKILNEVKVWTHVLYSLNYFIIWAWWILEYSHAIRVKNKSIDGKTWSFSVFK